MNKVATGLLAAGLVLMAGMLFGQNEDLSGTWVGETVVPNAVDKDQVILVLTKAGSSYSGSVTDSMGLATESPLEKVKFEKGTLTFEFLVNNGERNIHIYATLKFSANRLTGAWTSEDNETGPLDLTRKK